MGQINRDGYDERSTKIMMNYRITELSKLIGRKWFLPLEELAEQSGVPLYTILRAVKGEKIKVERYVKKLRDFLELL